MNVIRKMDLITSTLFPVAGEGPHSPGAHREDEALSSVSTARCANILGLAESEVVDVLVFLRTLLHNEFDVDRMNSGSSQIDDLGDRVAFADSSSADDLDTAMAVALFEEHLEAIPQVFFRLDLRVVQRRRVRVPLIVPGSNETHLLAKASTLTHHEAAWLALHPAHGRLPNAELDVNANGLAPDQLSLWTDDSSTHQPAERLAHRSYARMPATSVELTAMVGKTFAMRQSARRRGSKMSTSRRQMRDSGLSIARRVYSAITSSAGSRQDDRACKGDSKEPKIAVRSSKSVSAATPN
jgi:hypothetical protein